jgi:hypothetical protein
MGLISTKLAFLGQLLRGRVHNLESNDYGNNNQRSPFKPLLFRLFSALPQKGFKRKGEINELSGDMILHLPSQWVHAKN